MHFTVILISCLNIVKHGLHVCVTAYCWRLDGGCAAAAHLHPSGAELFTARQEEAFLVKNINIQQPFKCLSFPKSGEQYILV